MAETTDKIELGAELERARARLDINLAALRRDLDVAAHLKQSIHQNKAAYIGGATVFGLLLSKLPARKKKVYVGRKSGEAAAKEVGKEAGKAGLLLMAAQFALKMFRPMLTSLLTKQVTEFVRSRAKSG